MDEPFTALDPVNVQLAKDLMQKLRAGGTTTMWLERICNEQDVARGRL